MSNGTIRYGKMPGAHVIVKRNTVNDRLWSGEGDDTVRGNDGDDGLIGGLGDDNDFILGGNNITESFAGLDDDFVPAGDADDTVFGDDRMDLVEFLSGYNQNDILSGDDRNAAAMVGHELNAAGIARVDGLFGLLPAGATSFTGGDMIIGSADSDTIEGRGGHDVINGDAYLNARVSVRSATDPSVEIETVDTMAGVQARVLAGTINPGQL